jgi:hypothetical protein
MSLLFHFAAPICFNNCVPSSGSSSVPSGLNANLGFWLIKFRVVFGCVCTMWWPGVYPRTNIPTTTYYTEFYQPKTQVGI